MNVGISVGVHGEVMRGSLPVLPLFSAFSARLAYIYLNIITNVCLMSLSLKCVRMFNVDMTKSLLYRTSEEAFLGTAG